MSKNYIEKDLGLSRIVKELGSVKGSHVAVGVLSDKSTWAKGADANLADIAMFNEFGAPKAGIPSRPFMRSSFDKNINKVLKKQSQLQSDVFKGNKTEKMALKEIGVFFQGLVFKIFRTGGFAPNAPATINKKGSATPLVDTGRLRQSINHEVRS